MLQAVGVKNLGVNLWLVNSGLGPGAGEFCSFLRLNGPFYPPISLILLDELRVQAPRLHASRPCNHGTLSGRCCGRVRGWEHGGAAGPGSVFFVSSPLCREIQDAEGREILPPDEVPQNCSSSGSPGSPRAREAREARKAPGSSGSPGSLWSPGGPGKPRRPREAPLW